MRVMDACPSSSKICVRVFVSVCVYALWLRTAASYSIRLSVDTSPMHPVLVFHSSTFQHPLPLNTALSHLTPHTSSSKINVFFFTDLLILYYFLKNCMSSSEWIQKPKLNKCFRPVSLIKTVGSTRE